MPHNMTSANVWSFFRERKGNLTTTTTAKWRTPKSEGAMSNGTFRGEVPPVFTLQHE